MQKLEAPSLQPSKSTSQLSNAVEIAKCAKVLLGCYRTGDANDPAIYSGAVIAVLSDYPLDVVRDVVDPRTGLPAHSKWLPTVAEIKDACEARMRPRRLLDAGRAQLEERRQLALTDGRPKKTYTELMEECAARGLPVVQQSMGLSGKEVAEFRAQHGISQAEWDAIPNATRSA